MARMSQSLARIAMRAAQLALAAMAALYLWYFADHARQMLAFGYPLDYGEGPLLAQVERLRSGVPVWALYANPQRPPALIVNYPPLYLLVTAALAPLTGSALIAGRLISLASALGCVAALVILVRLQIADCRLQIADASTQHSALSTQHSVLLPLLFLTVPIVREWAALMRVDLLGVCLGLWGLVVLVGRPRLTPWRAVGAGLLLLACLFTKPSLIAAPGAAVGWLAWQSWQTRGAERAEMIWAGLALGATLALGGGLLFGLLQWASDGWFALHVVAANANRWDAALARGFWEQQLRLRWPLAVAALLATLWATLRRTDGRQWKVDDATSTVYRPPSTVELVIPALYTLLGAVGAAGVGKVGAYSNYFLELYAGLIWLVALSAGSLARSPQPERSVLGYALPTTLYALLCASLLFYPPLWDANRLRPAGLIEPSPPRLALGRYGLWADAARERELLAAQARVGAALAAEVRAAGQTIFTDMPGVAAAAAVASPLQAFEARQLLDQGLADEGALLLGLANGEPPLAVIDYLGNWLTPGVIEILQRRYAHDGSIGTFDLYRPVEAGPLQPLNLSFPTPGGPLQLAGLRLAAPLGATYEPGELLALSLSWRRADTLAPDELRVVVRLITPDGYTLLESERPLLYGVFPPARWPQGAAVQHMQPLALPAALPEGRYALAVGLRVDGHEPGAPQQIALLEVGALGGAQAETGHFVPATLRRAWAELGGLERAGLPLTPAVPFAWGRLQCFELLCLELRAGAVRQRPLGSTLFLAETSRDGSCVAGTPTPSDFCPGFAEVALRFAEMGAPISGEIERNGWLVQWTEQARLERPPGGGAPGLGRLGDESLRLPPGTPYRWP